MHKCPILNVGRAWRNIVPSLALLEQKNVFKGCYTFSQYHGITLTWFVQSWVKDDPWLV